MHCRPLHGTWLSLGSGTRWPMPGAAPHQPQGPPMPPGPPAPQHPGKPGYLIPSLTISWKQMGQARRRCHKATLR